MGDDDQRQLDHLERIAERNRQRVARGDKTAQKKEQLLKSRESGFDTFFSGANAERQEQRKLEREKRNMAMQLRLLKKAQAARSVGPVAAPIVAGGATAAAPVPWLARHAQPRN